jgi:acetolactate synthase-1/2/3 large subunit
VLYSLKVPSNADNYTKADCFAHFLAKKEVTEVFLLSGGMIAFLSDSIFRLGKTRLINVRHEQSAGFAAEGVSRINGKPFVAMATSGPGATNLITSIASSFFDSVPTIFITGQVNQKELKKNRNQRQNGFQELDIIDMVKNVTKHSLRLNSTHDVEFELNRLWDIALQGRPGPVLLDIPIDVQQELGAIKSRTRKSFPSFQVGYKVKSSHTKFERIKSELVQLINEADFPLILLGGGVRSSCNIEIVRDLIEKLKIPCVYSLMGVDSLTSNSKYRVGMIGTYGNRWANQALAKSDLIIALGSRLDIRQTGHDIKSFSKGKKIFRLDIDKAELTGRIKADYSHQLDLNDFINYVSKFEFDFNFYDWNEYILGLRQKSPPELEQSKDLKFNPVDIFKWINDVSENTNGFIVDVGQHQMWAAQSLDINGKQRFITSGGLGSMGFALPAAIGASITSKANWSVVSGDGCFQLSISELQTVKQYNLPLKIFILNNHQHGMVAQFQEDNLKGRFIATRDDYSAPNFIEIASAYGITGKSISNYKEMYEYKSMIRDWTEGPIVIEINVPNSAKALPKLGVNNSILDL